MVEPNQEHSLQGENTTPQLVGATASAMKALTECWASNRPGLALAGMAVGTAYRYLNAVKITIGDINATKPTQDKNSGGLTDWSANVQATKQPIESNRIVSDIRVSTKNTKTLAEHSSADNWADGLSAPSKQINSKQPAIADSRISQSAVAVAQMSNTGDYVGNAPTSDNSKQPAIADSRISQSAVAVAQMSNTGDYVGNAPTSDNSKQPAIADSRISQSAVAVAQMSNTGDYVGNAPTSDNSKQPAIADSRISQSAVAVAQMSNTGDYVGNAPTSDNSKQPAIADSRISQSAVAVAQMSNTGDYVGNAPTSDNSKQPAIADSRISQSAVAVAQMSNTGDYVGNASTSDNSKQPAMTDNRVNPSAVVAAETINSNDYADNSATLNKPNSDVTNHSQTQQANSQIAEKSNVSGQVGQAIVAQNEAVTGNQTSRTAIDSWVQAGGQSLDRAINQSLNQAIDSRFAELARGSQKENSISGITFDRPGSLLMADAAPGSKLFTADSFMLPGGMKDSSSLALSRESNSAINSQGLTTSQLSGIYINDTGLNAQGALSVKESNTASYIAGSQEMGRGIASGLPNSASLSSTIGQVLANMQGLAILQTGIGASQNPELTANGRVVSAPTGLTDALVSTGKKGATTEGISVSTIGSSLGLITTKGGKDSVGDVIDESKLPVGQIPANQSPLGAGIIVAAVTSTPATTGAKDPNVQNTTTSTTSVSTGTNTPTKEDWENSLPEIDIIDSSEKDHIEPLVKQPEALIHKEIDSDIEEDDDIENDQYVANEGRRGGGAFTPQSRSTDNIRGLIEIIIADTAGKKLDDAKAKKLFDELFGDNTRRQYTVKPGDTIEEIALRMLKDKRLIPLLLHVNGLTEKDLNGQYTNLLEAGIELELPTRSQILRYKIFELKDSTVNMVYANTLNDAAEKVSSDENNEYIEYTCRLGDTLKSIAKRHAAIADESKWEEIARLNELPTQCDANGQPVVVLHRGQKIYLPKPRAIVDKLEYEDEPETASVMHDGQTVPVDNVLKFIGKMKSITQPLAAKELALVTRVLTQSDLGDDDNNAFNLRLEMKIDNCWLPVVEYNINTLASGQPSGLKIYDLYGVHQIIPLDLPTRAARELAENDITINSQRYCQLFINNYQLAA